MKNTIASNYIILYSVYINQTASHTMRDSLKHTHVCNQVLLKLRQSLMRSRGCSAGWAEDTDKHFNTSW